MSRRLLLCAALLCGLVGACRKGAEGNGAPGGSAAPGAPAPLDTSWESNPGRLLATPQSAPNFEGVAHTGMRVRLSAFLDKPAVVYFYAGDRSPEATVLARSFRDQWLRLMDHASMVIGISPDDRVTHRDLATAEKLPFLLVADERNTIARAFGVATDDGGYRPTAFIVGRDGKIARVVDGAAPEGEVEAVLKALEVMP